MTWSTMYLGIQKTWHIMVNYVTLLEGAGRQTMREHGQPSFLVRTNHEITQ